MENFEQKIKSWFGALTKKDISYARTGVNPSRDWKILLTCAFVAVCAVAIFSIYLYIQVDNGGLFSFPADTATTNVTINQNLLDKTVQKMQTKQSDFNSAQKLGAGAPDPSL